MSQMLDPYFQTTTYMDQWQGYQGNPLMSYQRTIQYEAGIVHNISNEIKDRRMYGRRGTGGRSRVGQQEANLMTSLNPRPGFAAVPDEYEAPPSGDAGDIDVVAVRQPLEQQERNLLTAIGPRPPVAAGPPGDVTITGTYKPERYSPLPQRNNPASGLREVMAVLTPTMLSMV